MSERDEKFERIEALLAEQGLDALLLKRASSFAWATCGASSYINTASDYGDATLLIAPGRRQVFTTNIEAARIGNEEGLTTQGWEIVVGDWFAMETALEGATHGLKLGADFPYPCAVDLSAAVSDLRSRLLPEEGERFRSLGRMCAEAMAAAIPQIRPGQTEHEIAGIVAHEAAARGAWPTVDLVATDERIFRYRHPLPTAKQLERYAMVVLCGRRHGLVCSITRLVHFGQLPDELHHKQEACARVDASFLTNTRPGAALRDVFAQATEAYAAAGFPDEWRLHHQGGPAGYEPRETLGKPDMDGVVREGQAYAWNPSITGVKIEDTILVSASNNETLTEIPGWPMIEVEVNGQRCRRPAILER